MSTHAGKDGREESPNTLLVEIQICTDTMETTMEVPQKAKNR